MKPTLPLLLACFLLLSCGCQQAVEQVAVKWSPIEIECSTQELQHRFKGTVERGEADYLSDPPSGFVRVEYMAHDQGTAGIFRANRLEAASLLNCFDAWETHRPEVVYKSSGIYPRYSQKIVSGGCEHGERNCAD